MVTEKYVYVGRSWQGKLPAFLSASIAGMLLTLPALALAESEGVPLHGFADVGFALHSTQSPNPKGFNTGSFDVYLTPQFDNNVKGLVELIFETTADGSVATDLERVQMGYTFSDSATLWAGRFHTPYGYWNTGFHHGAQIQTAISRPRFLDFEDKGGIMPAHMVGLLGSGKIRAGDGKLTYDVFAGNGPKISMLDPTIPASAANLGTLNINTSGDNNHQAMTGLNLGYEFSGMMEGLRLAIHGLRGDVDDDALTPDKTDLNMAGASVVYLENDWEVLGEYYRFNNRDKSGGTGIHSSWADYLQLGRTFHALTPFLRFEKTVLSQKDNYFSMQDNGQSYTRQALGFKYELNQKASLKFEMLNSEFAAETGRSPYNYRSLLTQFAIRF
ncbi:MAG: hypothetical protein HY938_01950 [Nitrosomonadales bacterium]|nr:hypothetical protein [Nitrosomonadales bacterium]